MTWSRTRPDDVAPVRSGEELDWPRLARYLRERLPGLEGTMRVAQFPHGSANLTYLISFDGTELVVRRPPFGQVAPGAHDMRREYRALSRLWRHFPAAPRAYLLCDDHDVVGADFVVMERRGGEVIRDAIPDSMRGHADVGRRASFALVDAMAELHLLDPVACDVGNLGRADGFVDRQVAGWAKRWELARPADAPPMMDRLGHRLAAALPDPQRASVVHNDLKLDNCQFDPRIPNRVKSVFDWDMATLGDPLVDLGTLLGYWPDPTDPPEQSRALSSGMLGMGLPTRAEIVARYAERTGLDVGAVRWYEAFALWKAAVVGQQLYNRYARGESRDRRMATKADSVPRLAHAAATLLDSAHLPRR